MCLRRSLAVFSTLAIVPTAIDASAQAPVWTHDGARSCLFDAGPSPVACNQFHMVVRHRLKSGAVWNEYRYKWSGPHGWEVRYAARTGIVGISNFTTGELVDRTSDLRRRKSYSAVTYAPSREELIIGVPGEGYQFSVESGGF